MTTEEEARQKLQSERLTNLEEQTAAINKTTKSHDERLIEAFGRLHSLELRSSITAKRALMEERLDDLEKLVESQGTNPRDANDVSIHGLDEVPR